MGDLSKNFSAREFVCKCGCGKNNLSMQLVESLQQLRDMINAPVIIVSGCRCFQHNKSVGGVPNSKHLSGEAADICFATMFRGSLENINDMYILTEEIQAFRNGGIGLNLMDKTLHVDIRAHRARWVVDYCPLDKTPNTSIKLHPKYISIPEWIMGERKSDWK